MTVTTTESGNLPDTFFSQTVYLSPRLEASLKLLFESVMPRTVKVAVVGSGLAGLTAAHMLGQGSSKTEVEFEVHLFEKVNIQVCAMVLCLCFIYYVLKL